MQVLNGWRLRYAPHIGVVSQDEPLFLHLGGGPDPVGQIAFAASQGFAGVQYPWAAYRPLKEQKSVGRALRAHGLSAGVVVWTSRRAYRTPLWGRSDANAWSQIASELERSLDAAGCVGSGILGVVNAADEELERGSQLAAMSENLARAAEMAAKRGIVIGLEPMLIVPNMLLQTWDDGVAMVRRTGHASVKLIFDTAHVHQAHGADVLDKLRDSFDDVCLVQLADGPGRLEPGTGDVDFAGVVRELNERSYSGLVELEHTWSTPGAKAEEAGLRYLRALDATDAAQST